MQPEESRCTGIVAWVDAADGTHAFCVVMVRLRSATFALLGCVAKLSALSGAAAYGPPRG